LGAINRNIGKSDAKGVTLLHNQEGVEYASFSSGFKYYVRSYSNISTPPQYTLWNTGGGKIKDLELNAEYASRYAAAPKRELLKVKNDRGEEMNAFIIKPNNFDASKKYPLLMYQYNGPDSQEVKNSWKIDGLFYLAQEGYIIATVDGRGTGYRSREWANCVYKQLGKYETEDQLAATRYFRSLPYIDSSKTACFGWSYGGYMTLMELSAKDSPFKVGVAMAPVTDWRFYDSIYTERYMLTPQQNESGYDEASALLRTGDMNARLLIMSGTSDDNVHFYNTLKYTSKLTSENKLFDMMAYTAFEHSLRMCNARTMLYRKIADFLNTHLK
jgi:dipeptidyl-peptidase-4